MNIEVVWSGRGALPLPPGRTEDDDVRYQQRIPEPEPKQAREKVRAQQRALQVATSKKCEQCWTRFVSAGEVRKGHARCRVCRKAAPRRRTVTA